MSSASAGSSAASGYPSAMPEIVPLRVQLVAKTEFVPPADVPWSTDADGGQALAEFAGRACYQSWSKPNPAPPPTPATCGTSWRSGTCRCSSTARSAST